MTGDTAEVFAAGKSPVDKPCGLKIKLVREDGVWKVRAGLRYHEIAAAIDYSLVHTQLVMTGKRPASDAFMMRFARAYGYDLMRELFERNGQEGNHA